MAASGPHSHKPRPWQLEAARIFAERDGSEDAALPDTVLRAAMAEFGQWARQPQGGAVPLDASRAQVRRWVAARVQRMGYPPAKARGRTLTWTAAIWNYMGQWRTERSRLQAERGRQGGIKSGQARRKGTALEHNREPWKALGISRSTWFRRQAAKRHGS